MRSSPPITPVTPPAPFPREWRTLAVVCALVLGTYAWLLAPGDMVTELGARSAAEEYYNLQVKGFSAGRLDLVVATPEGLDKLANPYDPMQNAPYRGSVYRAHRYHDLSYYQGRFYLYFSPVPSVILFWPLHAITGDYLSHQWAVWIFCSLSFLVGTGILWQLRRRYFPAVSQPLFLGSLLALGLAAGTLALLRRPDVWEVPISCGHFFLFVALGCALEALADERRRWLWMLGGASAIALAIAARPSLVLGAAVLLPPLAAAWSDGGAAGRWARLRPLLLATLLPALAIGAALAWFNYARFGHALEFGQRYQLAGDRQDNIRHFDWRFLWFNFRLYFLSPVHWGTTWPYVYAISWPQLPAGHAGGDNVYGILVNTPITLLALLTPWIARTIRWPGWRRVLWSLALAFAGPALVLGCFYGACERYEFEFQGAFMLLAVVAGWTLLTRLKGVVRWSTSAVCAALLVFSIAFSLGKDAGFRSQSMAEIGVKLAQRGSVAEGVDLVEQALRLNPGLPGADLWLGRTLSVQLPRPTEAVRHYEAALRLTPDSVEAHNNLAYLLSQDPGRHADAQQHYVTALRLQPGSAEIHYNYGRLLEGTPGRLTEAIREYQTALRLKPDFAQAREELARLGRLPH